MGYCGKFLKFVLPVIVAYFILYGDKFNPESIKGKRILVTGASSGIGEEVAYKYAKLGAKLVITARRVELLQKVQQKCKELGAQLVVSVPADMAIPEDRAKLVSTTLKTLDGLDILILNHAWIKRKWWKNQEDDWKVLNDMININFLSYVDISSKLTNALTESKGFIGVVSSVAGKFGMPSLSSYCADKHAMQGYYAALRQELRAKGSNVSVTIIVYGPVASQKAVEIAKEDNQPFNYKLSAGTCEDAADVLVRGVAARQYEVYFPAIATFYKYGLKLFPEVLENWSGNQARDIVNAL
ncbi:hypothetical protein CHUAL_011273 [Chamberlinius hualienensis]